MSPKTKNIERDPSLEHGLLDDDVVSAEKTPESKDRRNLLRKIWDHPAGKALIIGGLTAGVVASGGLVGTYAPGIIAALGPVGELWQKGGDAVIAGAGGAAGFAATHLRRYSGLALGKGREFLEYIGVLPATIVPKEGKARNPPETLDAPAVETPQKLDLPYEEPQL